MFEVIRANLNSDLYHEFDKWREMVDGVIRNLTKCNNWLSIEWKEEW